MSAEAGTQDTTRPVPEPATEETHTSEHHAGVTDESMCLILPADGEDGTIKQVKFARDLNRDVLASAAEILGLPPGERVRCFHLPMFEKKLGWSLHLYIDLQGVEHELPHNTAATQLWLVANLPAEPPEVRPDVIHGSALLTAEELSTEEYINLDQSDWEKIKAVCREVQPNALFPF